jgi:hypothetical protein
LKCDILVTDGSFSGVKMFDPVFDPLVTNTTLKTLKLSLNKMGHAGAIVLAKALKKNTGLTALDVGGMMNEVDFFRKSIGSAWGEIHFGDLSTEYDPIQFGP